MQAIILAAGMGKRLGELTKNNTKCMVSVNGIPLIDRILDQLSELQLNKIVIVVGYKGEELIKHINKQYAKKINIEYIHNPIYDKTNNIYSLSLAKQYMQDDDTLLLESDLIIEKEILNLIINNPHPNLALVAKYETWMDGTMVCIDNNYNIINFISKNAFKYDDSESYYKTINIYKFSKEFSKYKYIPFLDAYCQAMGHNEYYEQVLRVISFLDKTDLKALPITTEKWYEIDDVQDLDIAECIFAKEEELLKRYYKRYGGFWRFPYMMDYCYLVNPYYPDTKLKDEMRANFDTLLTEYPSGMRVNTLIAGKSFGVNMEYIVTGNGAAELIKYLMEKNQGKIGVIYPTFEEYPNRSEKKNLVIFTPKNKNFTYNVEDLMNFYTEQTIQTLLLINPDNPSGNFISISNLFVLAQWCKEKNIQFILDESFVDFSDGHIHNTMLRDDVLETFPNLVVIKSISKSYGVPGLRLGILASSNKKLIKEIQNKISIWNINSFAEFFMQIFSKHEKNYHEACIKSQKERDRFFNELNKIPFLRVIPSQANYFLCEVLPPYTSKELTEILLKEFYILIKDCSKKLAFDGNNYIRISIRSKEENDKFIFALKNL